MTTSKNVYSEKCLRATEKGLPGLHLKMSTVVRSTKKCLCQKKSTV